MQVVIGYSLRAARARLTLAATGREGESKYTAAESPGSMAQLMMITLTHLIRCTDGQSSGCSVDIGLTSQFDQLFESCSALP